MEVNVCTTLTRCVHLYRHLDLLHLLRVEDFLGDGCSAPGDPAGQAQGGTLGSFRRTIQYHSTVRLNGGWVVGRPQGPQIT